MSELLKKVLYAGVGAFALTKEKIEEIVDDLVKKGETAADQRTRLVDDFLAVVEKSKREVQDYVRKEVQKVLTALDVPTRAEFEELKQKVEAQSRKRK